MNDVVNSYKFQRFLGVVGLMLGIPAFAMLAGLLISGYSRIDTTESKLIYGGVLALIFTSTLNLRRQWQNPEVRKAYYLVGSVLVFLTILAVIWRLYVVFIEIC